MLSGKTIIITGAGGALGQAAQEAVISNGGKVLCIGRRFPTPMPDDRPSFEIELTDAAAVQAVIDRVGTFDGVFNIAGGFAMGTSGFDREDDEWEQMQAANLVTVRNMAKAALPHLISQGHGAFVTVGAYAALGGAGGMSAYAASKSSVMSLTQSLAEEVKGKGVNVNCVLPTIIDTPANRAAMPDADPAQWVAPDRLAQTMCFLASDGARDIHGALIPVRGRS